jgi:electron transport complex protein RnfC
VKVDTLVINGGECEPYITSDHRMMIEHAEKVVHGASVIMKSIGVSRCVIGVEDNKMDAVMALTSAAASYPGIEVMACKARYPQGYEKAMVKATLGREVPPGGFPYSVGAVVVNVGTAAAVSDRFRTGMPVIKRLVTVSGSAVQNPSNIEAYIGTSAQDLVDQCGGLKGEAGKVLFGGPMMGVAAKGLDFPISKGTSGIVVFGQQEALSWKEMPCIRCGRCNEVCPMFIEPSEIHKYALAGNMPKAEKLFAVDCMECGCCSFVCPSKRPIVQSIKLAKQYVLAKRGKK